MPSDSQPNIETGTLVAVDATVFIEAVSFFVTENLVDDFKQYLEDQGVNELIMDVGFANHTKKFLAQHRIAKRSEKAQVLIMCSCGGNGGGGGGGGRRMDPMGIRG